jgi:hypothetical protein
MAAAVFDAGPSVATIFVRLIERPTSAIMSPCWLHH